jgi:ParB family transcriptional regulator, chromosome partitioning protein
VALAQKIIAQGLSVREAERLSAALARVGGQMGAQKPKKASDTPTTDPDLRRLSREIADLIGLSAEFKLKGKGGELRIRFSKADELDALFKKLGIEI